MDDAIGHIGRREWIKPILFTGGFGQMDGRHKKKGEPKKGMKVVKVGGPAYRIGMGGGAASSMAFGENRCLVSVTNPCQSCLDCIYLAVNLKNLSFLRDECAVPHAQGMRVGWLHPSHDAVHIHACPSFACAAIFPGKFLLACHTRIANLLDAIVRA